jgi:hypothetical protein
VTYDDPNEVIDALNRAYGKHDLTLELVHDTSGEVPMLWHVVCRSGEHDTDIDIIGAGDSASEAIEEARNQLRAWFG